MASTEHIDNNQIQYYYNSIFKKILANLNINPQNVNYIALDWGGFMFEKFTIQFYSIMQLTYAKTLDPLKTKEYFDIVSIHTLIRACYETYLLFEYIFNQPEEETTLRFLLYQYSGDLENLKVLKNDTQEYSDWQSEISRIHREICNNELFKSFSPSKQKKILGNWKPSWGEIAKGTPLSIYYSSEEYRRMSWYAHNQYSALTNADYYYKNLHIYDMDAINTQLYIVSTLFSNSMIDIFGVSTLIFTEDEIGIMREFLNL